MNTTIERLMVIFLSLFALGVVGVIVWQVGWAMPRESCEKAHRWWDGYSRVCAVPILTSDVTGRVITDPAARAEALKAIGRVPHPAQPAPKP